jgi:hypothetical protein
VGRAARRKRKSEKEKEGWPGPIRKREGKRNYNIQVIRNIDTRY